MDKEKIIIGVGAGAVALGICGTSIGLFTKHKSTNPLLTGKIVGYRTEPGDLYSIYVGNDIIGNVFAIWFEEPVDFYKFVYDNLRSFGLPVRGSLVGVGHAHKAGVHAKGRKEPMRGFNVWGVVAGKKYIDDQKPYFISPDSAVKYRHYWNMKSSVADWLRILRKYYPEAYQELMSRNPDPHKYQYGLQHGVDGRVYVYSENIGDVIEEAMEFVPHKLKEQFGYNI